MSREIFVQRSAQETPGLNLGFLLNLKPSQLQKGEVGIEIEVEGKNLPGVSQEEPPEPWQYKEDHSLRGEENGEYVVKKPVMFKDVSGDLDKLWSCFKKCKTKFDDSNRTSVHIHLNVQKWHLNRLAAFAALHFIFEEVLTEWCGDHRVGNLFCLRAKDAEAIITWLKIFIQRDGNASLPEGLHYAGFNVQALMKFGSVEVRTLRGTSDPVVIQNWVAIYQRLYELSGDFKDPTEICDWFSAEGPTAFFSRILGSQAGVVKNGISMTTEDIADSMYAGVRRAQDICFCRDWSLFKSLDVSDNPFGLSKKKLLEKAMAASGLYDSAPVLGDDGALYEPEPEYDDLPSNNSPYISAAQIFANFSNSGSSDPLNNL